MPHGGGGGSAGGGFHGGSHGGSGSGPHISHTYYRGAKRYRYLKSNGQYDYVYMDKVPGKSEKSSLIGMYGFFIAIILFIAIAMTISIVNPPNKLRGHYESPESHISGYSYLDNTDELEEALVRFEDTTGICPIVYCTYNDDWTTYRKLEDYAYDLYVDNYSDEEHFMLVYSLDPDDPGEWSWETMVGDDTDNILTGRKLKELGKALQADLEDGTEPGEAITKYFDNASDYVMKPDSETDGGFFPVFVMLFIVAFFIVAMVLTLRQYNRKYERVDKRGNPIDDDEVEAETESVPAHKIDPDKVKKASALSTVIVCVAVIPFLIIGFQTLVKAINALGEGKPNAVFLLIFALVWNGVIAVILISALSKLKKARRDTVSPDADVRKAETHAQEVRKLEPAAPDYPTPSPEVTDKPAEEKMNAFEKAQVYDETLLDAALNRESHVDYDDEDYKRMKKDGFE